ncbi:MAG: agmatinase [Candidatus Helarchaeota archaeon]
MVFEKVDKYELKDDSSFVILGIPFEATSTSPRAGAKEAPLAIRKAFNYFSLLTELGIDIFQKKIVDIGDIEVYPSLLEETMTSIEETISLILSLRSDNLPIPITLGGDHFITYPIIRKFLQIFPHKFGIIIFDAHVDLYDKWLYKEKYAHCTVFHRILELQSIEKEDLLFIGTRDIDYEEAEFLKNTSIKPISSHSISQGDLKALLSQRFQRLQRRGIDHVYVSIDIDVLDPIFAPGTGYPIPGGLTYRQLWKALDLLTQYFQVIGIDLVEVCPPYDSSEITSITAARLLMEFIGFITEKMK